MGDTNSEAGAEKKSQILEGMKYSLHSKEKHSQVLLEKNLLHNS